MCRPQPSAARAELKQRGWQAKAGNSSSGEGVEGRGEEKQGRAGDRQPGQHCQHCGAILRNRRALLVLPGLLQRLAGSIRQQQRALLLVLLPLCCNLRTLELRLRQRRLACPHRTPLPSCAASALPGGTAQPLTAAAQLPAARPARCPRPRARAGPPERGAQASGARRPSRGRPAHVMHDKLATWEVQVRRETIGHRAKARTVGALGGGGRRRAARRDAG